MCKAGLWKAGLWKAGLWKAGLSREKELRQRRGHRDQAEQNKESFHSKNVLAKIMKEIPGIFGKNNERNIRNY